MHTSIQNISLAKLVFSSTNPRLFQFAEDGEVLPPDDAIEGLCESIKAHGLVQPLTVRKIPRKDEFEIIAGHRRANAAKMAGLEEVPCSIVEFKGSAVSLQLIENLQRKDLTPYEVAMGIGQLLTAKVKQRDIAEQLGKSETWVSKLVTIAKAIKKQTDDEARRILMMYSDTEKLYARSREILGLDVKEAKTVTADAIENSDVADDVQGDIEEKIAATYEAAIAEAYAVPADAVKFTQHRNGGVTVSISFLSIDGFKEGFQIK